MTVIDTCGEVFEDAFVCFSSNFQPVTAGKIRLFSPVQPEMQLVLEFDYVWIIQHCDLPMPDSEETVFQLAKRAGMQRGNIKDVLQVLVFYGFNPNTHCKHIQTYKCESQIYNMLLMKNIGIAFHHIIFRRYCDQFGLPHKLNEEVSQKLYAICLAVEKEFGMSLTMTSDKARYAKFSRPKLATILLKKQAASHKVVQQPSAEKIATDSGDTLQTLPQRVKPANVEVQKCAQANIRYLIGLINAGVKIPKTGKFYRVTLRQTTFHTLVNYCLNKNPEDLTKLGLPLRSEWDKDPILLMDDSAKSQGVYQYVITDYKSLSLAPPGAYSEVFLEGHIITTVNFDIDRKGLPLDFELTEASLLQLMTVFLRLLQITVTDYFKIDIECEKLGELALYIRHNALPTKFSARIVWFLPYELVFSSISKLAEFTNLFKEIILARDNFFVYWTETIAGVRTKHCALDSNPFHKNKSCRLPNATKVTDSGIGQFKYIKSYNSAIISEQDYNTMNIGISRSPVFLNRPSLGQPHTTNTVFLLENSLKLSSITNAPVSCSGVAKERIDWYQKLFEQLWGSVKWTLTSQGNVRFSPTYPKNHTCLVHNRTHHKSSFSVVVTEKFLYPRCFHSDPAFIQMPPGSFLHLIEQDGKLLLTTSLSH